MTRFCLTLRIFHAMLIYPRLVTRGVKTRPKFCLTLRIFHAMLIYPRLVTRGVEQGLGSV